MKRFVLGAALAVLFAAGCQTASAADEDGSRHDGVYLGVVGGYATQALQAEDLDLATQGAFGGAVLGFGKVVGGTYYGLELDAMLRDIKPTVGAGATTVTMTNDWLASARLRVGLPIGPALFYSTGGIAVTESKLAVAGLGSDQQYVVGWVAGAGAEAALLPNMSIRVEALHYGLPSETFTISGVEGSIKQSETVARVGVLFRLN